jgi:hypothetical protein
MVNMEFNQEECQLLREIFLDFYFEFTVGTHVSHYQEKTEELLRLAKKLDKDSCFSSCDPRTRNVIAEIEGIIELEKKVAVPSCEKGGANENR